MNKFLLLITIFLGLNATSQVWEHFISSPKVYQVDVKDSLLIAGVDFRTVVYNINSGQTTVYRPDMNSAEFPIKTVGIDNNNSFWMGVNSGGNGLFKSENGIFTNYNDLNSPLPNNLPGNIYVNHTSNNIWLDINGQKATFDGVNYNPIGPYYGDCEELDDTLWIANTSGLIEYSAGNATTYTTAQTQLSSNDIDHVAVGNNGVWFSMFHYDSLLPQVWYTIGHYDGVNWMEYNTSNSGLPLISNIVNLEADTSGNLVIATNDKLIDFDGVNSSTYSLLGAGNLYFSINHLLVDDFDNRWVSTDGTGLLRLSGGILDTISLSNNPIVSNKSESVLVASDGTKWMAVSRGNSSFERGGLFSFDGSSWTSYVDELYDDMGSPYAIEEKDNGDIYAVGRLQTMKYDGSTWTEMACGPSGGLPNCDIDFGSDGFVWKGSFNSLIIKCDDASQQQFNLLSNRVFRAVELDFMDNVWVGTDHDIQMLNSNGNWTVYDYGDFGNVGYIIDIEFDSQAHLWAVSSSALLNFDGVTWTSYPFPWQGIGTDMEIDNHNNIWVSFSGGIAYFDGVNWDVYDSDNYLFYDDYVYEISLDLPGNKLWGSTYNGGLFSFEDASKISSLNELEPEDSVILYPNPASDEVTIKFDQELSEEVSVSVIDMKGVSVISQKINSTSTINVGMLEAGYYLVSIRMDDSKIIKRIVVK